MADLISDLYNSFYHVKVSFLCEGSSTAWKVPKRYKNLKSLYNSCEFSSCIPGETCSATDSLTGKELLITRIGLNSEQFSFKTFKGLLKYLRISRYLKHDNLLEVLDIFTLDEQTSDNVSLFVVRPKMGADLFAALRTNKLTNQHVQFLIYQLLCGLKYLHSAGITDLNLKTRYVWVTESCDVKIEVKMAKKPHGDDYGDSDYFCIPDFNWSPELRFHWLENDGPAGTADVWAAGCIMAELLVSSPLVPARDNIDFIRKIINLLGAPSDNFLDILKNEQARKYIRSEFRNVHGKTFSEYFATFGEFNPQAIDLLKQLIRINPSERITTDDAIAHPYPGP